MKNIFLVVFLLTINICVSQDTIKEISNTIYIKQRINADKYSNKEFIFSVALKTISDRPNGKIHHFLTELDSLNKFIKYSDLYVENTTSSSWKVYEIKGILNQKTKNITLGIQCFNKGDFYIDNFNLKIKNDKNKWETVNIKDSDFENQNKDEDWHTKNNNNIELTPFNFTFQTTSQNPYRGKYCLHVKGSDIYGSSSIGKFVEVNGVKLYYEIYGEGQPILLLTGNGQSIYDFKNQIDVFSKSYKVIAVDYRGRGNSSYEFDRELTFDVETEDIFQFLNKINIDKTHIVGWSDGGILGILMAIKHPEKVDKMVSMAGNIFPDGIVDKEELMTYINRYKELNTNHQYDKYIDFLNLDYKYPNLKYEDLKVIKSRCLIMAGDRDEIKTEHTVKMAESIPNAQLAIVPNATHYLPSKNPELFNAIILRFLKE